LAINYRPEIDGLRAFAVISVILFHAGLRFFEGGYVGVDVFFVISGYLITKLIITEIKAGKFSIINFYERRARRLLPALYFVMALCIPFAWFLLTPSDLKEFGQSLTYVSIFSSNFLFWLESGYFEIASEFKPLLHTWSLALEEQFYIFFPISLILIWRFGTKSVLLILSSLFLLSFLGAEWASLHSPDAGFYLLVTRAWELLIGVFTAFFLESRTHFRSRLINQIISLLGFAMILYAVFTFDALTPFPGHFALIPTVGTCLMILCAVPNTFVYKLLTLKPVLSIGLISYSAYLLHQPLLAFARHKYYGGVSETLIITLCVLSMFLAWISYRFIERPFRENKRITSKNIFIFSISGLLIFPLIGISMQHESINSKSPNKLENVAYTSLNDKLNKVGSVCDSKEIIELEEFIYCEIGFKESDQTIILYGDSHAESIQYVLDEKFKSKKIRGIWIQNVLVEGVRCDSSIFTTNVKKIINKSIINCPDSFSKMIDSFDQASYLILFNRWSRKYYYSGSYLLTPHFENKSLGCIELEKYRSFIPLNKNGFQEPTDTNMREAVTNLLNLSLSKIKTIVVFPIPEIGCDPYKLNLAHRSKTGSELVSLSFPIEEYDSRNRFLIDAFQNFSNEQHNLLIKVPTRSAFCKRSSQEGCVVIEDSLPLYLDDDHLSDKGANIVVNEIFKFIDE
jgi:peptidoglycan/LPS O-acetylase OafA/YrhL